MLVGRKYTYTQHSDESIGQLVQTQYLPSGSFGCRFYVSGLHDNYLIEQSARKYILRVYRTDWRNDEEVKFELELLNFLQQRKAPVAGPVCTRKGSLWSTLESAEGRRMAALFFYAAGRAPEGSITAEECRHLGCAVAEAHRASDDFATSRVRPELEFMNLVEKPIALYSPYIDPDARVYLEGLQNRLHEEWPRLAREAGVYGPCTGDINSRNFHITAEQKITLFDFDQCGMGFRALELGKFASSIHQHSNKQELLDAFLAGYQQVRRLGKGEVDAIPIYEMAAVIWVLGIAALNLSRIGYKYTEKPYWGRKIEMLKALEMQRMRRMETNSG